MVSKAGEILLLLGEEDPAKRLPNGYSLIHPFKQGDDWSLQMPDDKTVNIGKHADITKARAKAMELIAKSKPKDAAPKKDEPKGNPSAQTLVKKYYKAAQQAWETAKEMYPDYNSDDSDASSAGHDVAQAVLDAALEDGMKIPDEAAMLDDLHSHYMGALPFS